MIKKQREKIILICLLMLLALFLVSCSSSNDISKDDVNESSVLEGNTYFAPWNSDYALRQSTIGIAFVRFHPDGVVEWVHTLQSANWGGGFKADKYYGTYELDGRTLTIVLALSIDVTMTCVVHENGDSITIGGEKFSLSTNSGDDVLNMFD